MIILNLGEQIQVGDNYNLTLTFDGQPNEADVEGLYAGSYEINPGSSSDDNIGNISSVAARPRPEVRWFAVTQMEPAAARKLFPCFDEPLFKAVFSITVVYEAEFTVLSNMPFIEDNPIKDLPGNNPDSPPPPPPRGESNIYLVYLGNIYCAIYELCILAKIGA